MKISGSSRSAPTVKPVTYTAAELAQSSTPEGVYRVTNGGPTRVVVTGHDTSRAVLYVSVDAGAPFMCELLHAPAWSAYRFELDPAGSLTLTFTNN